MTYEEIKEELDKTYERQSWTQDEIDFNSVCKGYPMTGTSLFIAGFRAAERLAKIEVLEELSKTLASMGYDGMYNYGTVIDRMLSGLKAKGH